jgi:triacylglycerol lipase
MDEYVGSLTTVCTPHQGCKLVDSLLNMIPDKAVLALSKRYNSFYKKLGDKEPNFYSGIYDLTVKQCSEFNEKVIDKDSVIYQSVASEMKNFFSASFPLNIGYLVIRRSEGENDGFVTTESSKWGNFLGCYATKNKRGISQGDMIDLMRENIPDFDICECYVEIVKGLKAKNL